ncbi:MULTISPECIES: glycogen/starch/alpha-glucan phosphorylase [Prochlorococcus]|uniref:glycogen/starch/alpha-glucan phosphorylase n=1 Tax=Prochlorococcus TaxID=1218 RepID=UPI0007B3D646|nr:MULTISPECIES: glycogen/starch/alpha-glucan phosphorylase [Prochlorococcus]KZR63839.1 Maltodextrin phosphorylase [Prochlorococcus marinus str. MIT 1312]KZR78993.1 Maltodextrin phosphorylase [Prochlorococcus marinus str. MIT 1327]NMO85421.1 glycogen/starch/alpha-glucan phosphorylase [Prochlorococcus sp. P1344]NMP05423.1 glycogen/starch/alpha-glucan phosphorylase [Prochlorococcus sp. P1361]NMP13799.1 glycogen/starch/alpha-glucan phosphorylase [Prochlorococcus sp.P1363]
MSSSHPLDLRLPTPGCFADPERAGLDADAVFDGMTEHLFFTLGKLAPTASNHDLYMALSYAVRDRLMTRYLASLEAIRARPHKTVAYLSAEFLIGPQLNSNLLNLGISKEIAEQALRRFRIESLDQILEVEEEPGLGNGGLGRLAACYMESLASLQVPAIGYGIRYEFGIFNQLIRDGWQVEVTDKWLKGGWPWELPQPEEACFVGFGGRTESYTDGKGNYRSRWIPSEHAIGIPHDVPVLGYRVNTCNRLRLWRADATESFDFYAFNIGDYYGAVEEKVGSETLSKVLYPNDGTDEGRRLRLKQQHFFVSCSLQDMLRSLGNRGIPIEEFPNHWTVQLNDTHPAIAVAELMRLLIDEHYLDWDTAWDITTRSVAYTNHTLLPEALEKWDLTRFASLLPRHLELIYEINRRFLQQVRLRYPGNDAIQRKLSIIDEDGGKAVRMANLATIAAHHVNGVAALHSDLLKRQLMPEFAEIWPEKFTNVTNGVTPRRWVALANPALSRLLDEHVGPEWITNMELLTKLEERQHDTAFLEQWGATKLSVKRKLAGYIHRQTGVLVDPSSLFDVQVKRIHEYKRQHLNALQVITHYLRIKNGQAKGMAPRTVIFGGKAAPGYYMAKLIIRFINGIAETINADPDMEGRLRVVFLPDYNVKLAEQIYPASDLSEQVSTAGKEASGTGNMKFAMNGALTIGTLDGANVEIRERVGPENFFLFGKTETEIMALQTKGYRPRQIVETLPELAEALRLIGLGHFSNGDGELFRPLLDNLTGFDPFFVLADFADYLRAQDEVNQAWTNRKQWNRMSLLNTARTGFFSSDRSIQDYCQTIWKAEPFPVEITCDVP